LWACRKAKTTLIGSFLNLRSLAGQISLQGPDNLLLLCGGTQDEAAYEDILGAGAFCDLVWSVYVDGRVADSAQVARHLYRHVQNDLLGAVQHSRNAQRLLANPELREDVNVCLQRDVVSIVAGLDKNGLVRKLP
jgi:phosphosulfolactate phosphohydrolase-like enzyme